MSTTDIAIRTRLLAKSYRGRTALTDLNLTVPANLIFGYLGSHGTRQKVGIVQAFMHRPAVLVLDEPTAGLDPLVRREFLGMVREVRQDGRTVFLSSHNLYEVEAVADMVGILRQGAGVQPDGQGPSGRTQGRGGRAAAARHPGRDGQPVRPGGRLETRRMRSRPRTDDAEAGRGRAALRRDRRSRLPLSVLHTDPLQIAVSSSARRPAVIPGSRRATAHDAAPNDGRELRAVGRRNTESIPRQYRSRMGSWLTRWSNRSRARSTNTGRRRNRPHPPATGDHDLRTC